MTESKEAMQNTIKNLQAKSDFIYKLEDKGSKTIVLQIGSHTIKMGFANQRAPFSISPYIAYRKLEQPSQVIRVEEGFDFDFFKEQYHKTQDSLKIEGVISLDNKPFKGKPRAKQIINIDRIPNSNSHSQILFGDEALRVEYNPNFIFRKIITHGVFNVENQSQEKQRISDIQNLFVHMLKNKIKIPEKQWSTFNCILIVPDLFIRRHIKMIVKCIFLRIGFKKLYIHLESVMACFGTAVSTACVVDIGHQKISVCCVDEGVILPKTLVKKNFGSKDISKILSKLFNERINDQYIGSLKSNSEGDLFFLDKIKQIACAIRQPQETINRIYEINPIRNNVEYALQIAYTDAICIASNSFFSEIWNSFDLPDLKDPFNPYSKFYDLYEDSEDYFQEFSGGGHVFQVQQDYTLVQNQLIFDPFIYQPLEDIILASLFSIKDSQIRKKFNSSILFIGGGAHMPKLIQEVMARINSKLIKIQGNITEEKAQLSTDLVLRQIAPIHASWLGGTVIPKLDSLRDLWIEKGKFLGYLSIDNQQQQQNILDKRLFTRKQQSQEWGIRYLKQKVPFIW